MTVHTGPIAVHLDSAIYNSAYVGFTCFSILVFLLIPEGARKSVIECCTMHAIDLNYLTTVILIINSFPSPTLSFIPD